MTIVHVSIILPFIMAAIIPVLYKYVVRVHPGWFVLIFKLILFIYFLTFVPLVMGGGTKKELLPWVPSLGINFTVYIDGLSLIFALLITGIGSLVILYSIYYLSKQKEALGNFYTYILLFMGAMLGVVLSDNLIVLYVFWELTSLSSFLLIAFWFHRKESTAGALKSMLVTVSGGFAMLAGFSLLYVITGTFSIREIIDQSGLVLESNLFLPALILLLAGAFTKSAQFPFHFWLPDAMEAPTPVSAYLHSATMVKAGIYLVARFTPVFGGTAEWFWIIVTVGMITLLWGAYSAVKQTDLKALVAFGTISQLGLIMTLLGVGSAAIYYEYTDETKLFYVAGLAAIFHLINHATFKGTVFMVVGIIDHETGTRDIRKLGGLMSLMPLSFTLAVIGGFSMAGLPPFNGFLSKEMFFTAVINILQLTIFQPETILIVLPIVAWLASIFTFLYSMIFIFKTFTGKLQLEKMDKKPHEAPFGLLISPIILASFVLLFFFYPNILSYSVLEPAMMSIYPNALAQGEHFYVNIYAWHGWNTELMMTMGVVSFGTLFYWRYNNWANFYENMRQKDPFNNLYDQSLVWLIEGSTKITAMQMTGRLRDYFTYLLTFIILLLTFSIYRTGAFTWEIGGLTPIPPYVWVISLVLFVSSIVIPFMNHRLSAIIITSVCGFLLALLFAVFRAPDLALTQILVETVMIILFLVCLKHLPELRKEKSTLASSISRFVISVAMGGLVVIISVAAYFTGDVLNFEAVSDFYIENSYTLAGGKNIVNVILVNFRGLDTLLEVLVLGIAALGIVMLLKLKLKSKVDV